MHFWCFKLQPIFKANFYIMAAILDFRALEREKNMPPYFFLMFISYSNRIRRVFAFYKKKTRTFISRQMSLHYQSTRLLCQTHLGDVVCLLSAISRRLPVTSPVDNTIRFDTTSSDEEETVHS